jgi:hypothetical protein
MVGNFSSSYFEAFTLKKIYFIAGASFGPLLGNYG